MEIKTCQLGELTLVTREYEYGRFAAIVNGNRRMVEVMDAEGGDKIAVAFDDVKTLENMLFLIGWTLERDGMLDNKEDVNNG